MQISCHDLPRVPFPVRPCLGWSSGPVGNTCSLYRTRAGPWVKMLARGKRPGPGSKRLATHIICRVWALYEDGPPISLEPPHDHTHSGPRSSTKNLPRRQSRSTNINGRVTRVRHLKSNPEVPYKLPMPPAQERFFPLLVLSRRCLLQQVAIIRVLDALMPSVCKPQDQQARPHVRHIRGSPCLHLTVSS